ncbi:hypothetical protein AVEN_16656-1 [Araneus ventricosus]|uniref:Uncharacterized protein n=1 Tax=Araneus ventricosus TaxID=182803 RepID=A0A4Y2X3S9_ARAVE|nr:hypothetical protein AVEN_16656-1 [Araneus ventricosus]
MLSDGGHPLRGDSLTASKTQELLRKFKWEVWNNHPYNDLSSPNLSSKHFLGTGLLSGEVSENLYEGHETIGRGRFCQSRLCGFCVQIE